MQISKLRMQNEMLVCGIRRTGKKKTRLIASQAGFCYPAQPEDCALTGYSAFCVLTSAFDSTRMLGERP